MTEFRDLLRQRRMVRSYLPDPVGRETIERIVGVVHRAPSAGFSQGHRLVVVTDEGAREELARLAGEEEYVEAGLEPWISIAPVHVVVGVREESYHERYRKEDKLVDGEEITWPAPYWYVDSGSLFMLLQLAALDEGLGTGIYGVAGEDVPALKKLVGLPDDVHFVCVITIGKRPPAIDESPLVSRLSQRRLPLDELVAWDALRHSGRRPATLPAACDSARSQSGLRSWSSVSPSPPRQRPASSSATSTSPSSP